MAINYASVYAKIYGANAPLGDAGGMGGSGTVLIDQHFSSGTSANQFDRMYHDERTLVASANEDLDLTTILDPNGVAIALVDVVCMVIEVSSAAAVDVSPGAANGFDLIWDGTSALLHMKAGSKAIFYAPVDPGWVVDGTHKVINFLNLSGAVSAVYTLTIFGRSA